MKKLLTGVAVAACLAVFAAPAMAHVTASPDVGSPGGSLRTAFKVGHGCGESPTHTVRVRIPAGVVGVTPEQIPGWEVSTTIGELEEPVELHGEEITEGVQEITWEATGEPLGAHHFLEFGVSMTLPESAPDGQDALYFPIVQNCEEGNLRWVNIPPSVAEWGDTEDPAPYVTLGEAAGGHGGEEAEDSDAESMATGDMVTEDDVRAITDEMLASAGVEGEDDSDLGVVLGGVGLGLGAIALIVALIAMRKRA